MTPSRRSSLKRQKGGFMKRRKFIEATLLAVPAASSAAGMRLYGTPGSVAQLAKAQESEKLLLPISKSGLPPEFWSKIKSVTSIVDNVLKSQEEGEAFYSAPGNYLASHGLDSSDATLQEESVKLVAAISSSRAREFMEKKEQTEKGRASCGARRGKE